MDDEKVDFTMHIRVKTDKYDASRISSIYGWECETCGTVTTDHEGTIPLRSAQLRGLG